MQASQNANQNDTGEMSPYSPQPTRAASEDRLPESHGNLLDILSSLKGPAPIASDPSPTLPHDVRAMLVPYAETLKVSSQKIETLRQESIAIEQRFSDSWDALGFRERYLPRLLINLFGGDISAVEQRDSLRDYHARIESALTAEQQAHDKTQAKADFIVEEHLLKSGSSYSQLFSTMGSLTELQKAANAYDGAISRALSIFMKARWEEQHSFLISVPWAPASAHFVGEHAQASVDAVVQRHADYAARAREFVAQADSKLASELDTSLATSASEAPHSKAADNSVLFRVASMLSVFTLRDAVDNLNDLSAALKKERVVLDAVQASLGKELTARCRETLRSCLE